MLAALACTPTAAGAVSCRRCCHRRRAHWRMGHWCRRRVVGGRPPAGVDTDTAPPCGCSDGQRRHQRPPRRRRTAAVPAASGGGGESDGGRWGDDPPLRLTSGVPRAQPRDGARAALAAAARRRPGRRQPLGTAALAVHLVCAVTSAVIMIDITRINGKISIMITGMSAAGRGRPDHAL